MFKKLQEEQLEWATNNFGAQLVEDYELGLIEEVGELAHSFLKRKQGIRNTEDHDAKIIDAIGDITIFLAGFCSCKNINLNAAYKNAITIKSQCSITDVHHWVDALIYNPHEFEVSLLIGSLKSFCNSQGIDFENTVKETWDKVVKKRDWKEDPDFTESKFTDYPD